MFVAIFPVFVLAQEIWLKFIFLKELRNNENIWKWLLSNVWENIFILISIRERKRGEKGEGYFSADKKIKIREKRGRKYWVVYFGGSKQQIITYPEDQH